MYSGWPLYLAIFNHMLYLVTFNHMVTDKNGSVINIADIVSSLRL